MAKGKHSNKNKIEPEKGFTSLQEDAIIASMICLDEAFVIAKKRKDVSSLITLADKWFGLSHAFEEISEEIKKPPFGFNVDGE